MSEFQKAMQEIVDHRGGKLRVPDLLPFGYTYYITPDVFQNALADGYIDSVGNVTTKFREEYDQMFDKIGQVGPPPGV